MLLPRQPRIPDNGISLYEGHPRQSAKDKKKEEEKVAATAFALTLHTFEASLL